MENFEFYMLGYFILFLFILIVYYFMLKKKYLQIIGTKKSKKKKKVVITEIQYLSSRFKLKEENLLRKWVLLWISFINAMIISIVAFAISIPDIAMVYQLLIAFLLLIGLIYSLYEIFGRVLKKKGL